jgi:transcriptional regulator with XRE-family HTH domain
MAKNTDFSERILQVIDYFGITRNDFAKKIGYKRSQALYDMINGKALPSYDFFSKLLSSEYSEINIEWLITGKGAMLKSEELNTNIIEDTESPPYVKQCVSCQEKERLIETLRECIKAKDITIESLLSEQTIHKEYIENLKKQLFEAHQEKPGEQKRKAS